MDALKRASEKQNATEHRTRQKVLALQEAVKQALAAAEEAEEENTSVRDSIPSTEARLAELESDHARLKEEAKQSNVEADSSITTSQKRITEMQSELSALTHRLDRLNGKKERVETETLPELEKELTELRFIYSGLKKGDASASGGVSKEREDSGSVASHQSQLSGGSSHKGRLPPIGRPPITNTTTSPRPVNKLPRRPGILNVQHILQRTPP